MSGSDAALTAIIFLVVFVITPLFVLALTRYRGVRVITCPDNREAAAVRIDALRAATSTALLADVSVRLRTCSRWPEMADCGQECLRQIVDSPTGCRLQEMVADWYDGKRCTWCGKMIEPVVWHERPPALRSPEGTTVEWKDFAPEQLPSIFDTHAPVCWPCHNAASFRRQFPELVIDRPPHASPGIELPSDSVY
jgi:hypothetical protein